MRQGPPPGSRPRITAPTRGLQHSGHDQGHAPRLSGLFISLGLAEVITFLLLFSVTLLGIAILIDKGVSMFDSKNIAVIATRPEVPELWGQGQA